MAIEHNPSSPEANLNLAREIHTQIEDIFDFSTVDRTKLPYALPTGDTLTIDEAQQLVTEMKVEVDGSLTSGEPIADIIHDRAILDIVNTLPQAGREQYLAEGKVVENPAQRLKLIQEVLRNVKQNGIEEFSRTLAAGHNWNASEVLTSLEVLAVRYANESTAGGTVSEEEVGGEVRSVQKKTRKLKLPASYIPGQNSLKLGTQEETSLYNVSTGSAIENKHGMKATFADARASVMASLREGRVDTAFSSAMDTFGNIDNLSEESQVVVARRLRLAINNKIREIQEGPQDTESQALAMNLNALGPLLVEDAVTGKAQSVDAAAIKEGMQLLFPASTALEQQLKTPATRDQALQQLSQRLVDWGHVVFGREYQKAVNTDLRMGVAVMDLALPPAERLKRIQLEQQIHRLQQGLEGSDAGRIAQYREEMLQMSTEGQAPSDEQQRTHQILQRLTSMNPEVVEAKKQLEELRAKERKLVLCAFNVQVEDGSPVVDETSLSPEDLALVKQIREYSRTVFTLRSSNQPVEADAVNTVAAKTLLEQIGITSTPAEIAGFYRALNTKTGEKTNYEGLIARYFRIDKSSPQYAMVEAIMKDTRRIDRALAGMGRKREDIRLGGDELLMGLKGLYFMDQNMQLEEGKKKLEPMTAIGQKKQIRDTVDIFKIVQGADNADELANAFAGAIAPEEPTPAPELAPDETPAVEPPPVAPLAGETGDSEPLVELLPDEPPAATPPDEESEEPAVETLPYPEREKVLKTLAERVYKRFIEETPDVQEGVKTRVIAKIREKLGNADTAISQQDLEQLTADEDAFAEVLAELEYLPRLPEKMPDKHEPIRFMFRTDDESGQQFIMVTPEKKSRVIILGPDAGAILNPPVLDDDHPDARQWELIVIEGNEKSDNVRSTQRSELNIENSGIEVISVDSRLKLRVAESTIINPLTLPAEYDESKERPVFIRNKRITRNTYYELGDFTPGPDDVYELKTDMEPKPGFVMEIKGFQVRHNRNIPVYIGNIFYGDKQYRVSIHKETDKNGVTYSIIANAPPEEMDSLQQVCDAMFTATGKQKRKVKVKLESSFERDAGDEDISEEVSPEAETKKNIPKPISDEDFTQADAHTEAPTPSQEAPVKQRSFLEAFPGWRQDEDGFYYRENAKKKYGFREISQQVELTGKDGKPAHGMELEFNIEGKKRKLHVLHLGDGQFRLVNPKGGEDTRFKDDEDFRNGVMYILEGLYYDKQSQPHEDESSPPPTEAPATMAPAESRVDVTEVQAPKEHPELATIFADWQRAEDGFMYPQDGDHQFGFRINAPGPTSPTPLSQTNLIIADFNMGGETVRATITGIRNGNLNIRSNGTLSEQQQQIISEFIEQYFASGKKPEGSKRQPPAEGAEEIQPVEAASDIPTVDLDKLTETFEEGEGGFKHAVISSDGLTVPVDIKYGEARRAKSGNSVQDVQLQLNGIDIEPITLTIDERRTVEDKTTRASVPNRNYGKVVLYTHEAGRTRELIQEVLAKVMNLDMDQIVVRPDAKRKKEEGDAKPKRFGLVRQQVEPRRAPLRVTPRKVQALPDEEGSEAEDPGQGATATDTQAPVSQQPPAEEAAAEVEAAPEADTALAQAAPEEPAHEEVAPAAPSNEPEHPAQAAEARFPAMVEGDSPRKRELSTHLANKVWELLDHDDYVALYPNINKILRTHAAELGIATPKMAEVTDEYLAGLNNEQWAFILSQLISEQGNAKVDILELNGNDNHNHLVIRIDINGSFTDPRIINMLNTDDTAGPDRHHVALLGEINFGQGITGLNLNEAAHIGNIGIGSSTIDSIRSIQGSIVSESIIKHIRNAGNDVILKGSTLELMEHGGTIFVEYPQTAFPVDQNVGELRSVDELSMSAETGKPVKAVIGDVAGKLSLDSAQVLIFSDKKPELSLTHENIVGYVARNLNDEKMHMRRIMQQYKADTIHTPAVSGNLEEVDITTLLPEGEHGDLYPLAINGRLYLVVEADLLKKDGNSDKKGLALVEVNRTNFTDDEPFVFKLVKMQEK